VGFDREAPWDSVIAASAFSHEGPLAAWWQTHFVLPATMAGRTGGIQNTVDRVDNNVAGGKTTGQNGNPKPAPKGDKDQNKRNPKSNICQIWNLRRGACAKDGPCKFKREHRCDFPGCDAHHRSIDHHAVSQQEPPAKKPRKENRDGGKWKKQR